MRFQGGLRVDAGRQDVERDQSLDVVGVFFSNSVDRLVDVQPEVDLRRPGCPAFQGFLLGGN